MPETIIAAVDIRRPDDTRDALALAARLAPLTDAELLAVTVIAPSRAVDVARCESELTRTVQAAARGMEGTFAFSVRAVPAGSPGRIVHELSERMQAAAVVIGSSMRDPDGRWLPGSVGESLLHGGDSPVVVAPRGFADRAGARLGVIAAGFEDTAEAREALRHAARLAAETGADLRVITVVEPFLYSHIAMGHEHEALEVEHALRQRAESALEEAVAGLPAGVRGEPFLVDGAAVPTFTRLSAGLDLLVLGSRGYGAPRAVLLGPVSRELVRCVECPVMIVPRAPGPDPEVALIGGISDTVNRNV
jgi:nucleotide-binding universal stress UspA family protein